MASDTSARPAEDRPPTIDPPAAARWARTAPAEAPWLHEEVARRMAERLQWIRLQPERWAHWEAVRGGLQGHALVAGHYQKAACDVVESRADLAQLARHHLTAPWWKPGRWGAPAVQVIEPQALRPGSVQMLWSNMALHLASEPQALMAHWHRALAVDGFLMFSCLGPDTAHQLRAVYAAHGWPSAGAAFTDMHDWGDMLVHAGFAEPVMDMERITLSFDGPQRLLRELRGLGRNLHPARFGALRGRGWPHRVGQALGAGETLGADGKLVLTFEILYGPALKPRPRARLDAETAVSLGDMQAMLRGRKSPGR